METALNDPAVVVPTDFGETHPARSRRGFYQALIATQFQGAYSDNILRNLLLSMVVGMGLARSQREAFRFGGGVSVFRAVPAAEHAGRMAGGPLQQAPDHDLDQGTGVRVDGCWRRWGWLARIRCRSRWLR